MPPYSEVLLFRSCGLGGSPGKDTARVPRARPRIPVVFVYLSTGIFPHAGTPMTSRRFWRFPGRVPAEPDRPQPRDTEWSYIHKHPEVVPPGANFEHVIPNLLASVLRVSGCHLFRYREPESPLGRLREEGSRLLYCTGDVGHRLCFGDVGRVVAAVSPRLLEAFRAICRSVTRERNARVLRLASE